MITIQAGLLVNTDRISIVQLKEIKKKLRVEIIVDNRSYIVDEDKVTGELRDFLRGAFDNRDLTKQFTAL
jgi:hypothetical protein